MEFDPKLTAAYLAGKIDEYVKQAARDTVLKAARRDRHARYARIPDGSACDWCVMLGSRGFVYHSQEAAEAEWHPFCNCQIATAFDPYIEEYWTGGGITPTKVTRGHADDGLVARPGRDGSLGMREVDIDELFDRYAETGKSFTGKSKLHDYSEPVKLSEERFDAAMRSLDEAKTMDELKGACEAIEREFGDTSQADKEQWIALRDRVRELKAMLA